MRYINKKKVRGWPCQIRKMDRIGSHMLQPNLDLFNAYGKTYERFYIDPWCRIIKRNPPVWFFKKMIQHLIRVLYHWEKIFDAQNQHYDLQIWLYTKTFINSEIYCGKVDSKGEEINIFEASASQKRFPAHIFGLNKDDHIEWRLYNDLGYFSEYDVLELEGSLNNLPEKVYSGNYNSNGEKYYTRLLDEVWIGRLRK